MNNQKPAFPLTVVFEEDGDTWVLNNEEEAANSLEWFDSRKADEKAKITDSLGRKVTLVVEKLEVKLCEVAA